MAVEYSSIAMKQNDPRAEQIFATAIEIGDSVQRRAHIERACAGNASLKAEVESLLAAHEQAGEFLQTSGMRKAEDGERVEPETQIELLARSGSQILAQPVLGPGDYVLGRGADCDIVLDSLDVSQRHARLLVSSKEIRIEDLGSSNGTFVKNAGLTKRCSCRCRNQ